MGWASQTRKKLNRISRSEKIVEEFLRENQIGYHRNRCVQVAGGKYRFIDFSLRKPKVFIEIDGSEHSEERDKLRQDDLLTIRSFKKYQVIRFKNSDILTNFNQVKETIMELLAGQSGKKQVPSSSPSD